MKLATDNPRPAVAPTVSLPLLQQARVASPCSMRWEDMTPTGETHTRRCEQCNLNVHNFADMTGEQAEAILRASLNPDGTRKHRVCAGIYRRADGTILTADCPVGLAAVRARAHRAVARIAAAIGLTALVTWAAARESNRYAFAHTQPLTAMAAFLRGEPVTPPLPALPATMDYGDIALPTPQPAPPVLNWLDTGTKQ